MAGRPAKQPVVVRRFYRQLWMKVGMYTVGPQKPAPAARRFTGQQYAGLAVICMLMGFPGRRWPRAQREKKT